MRRNGLEVLFSIFLGILVVAFVGAGVYTFYSPPREYDAPLRELDEQRRAIIDSRRLADLSAEEREQINEIDVQRDLLWEASRSAHERWGRTTSIILIAIATLAMAVSLVRADQLPVISSGLLLGGVLTMLYGVGWIVTTDSAMSRFAVITVALMITLLFGYIRFVRQRSISSTVHTVPGEGAINMASMEQRLRDLEQRLDEAAGALGRDRHERM